MLENLQTTPTPKEKKIYDSFKEVERIEVKLITGGSLFIVLKSNDIRVFKIEYYLNDLLLKPENLQGKHLAYKRWSGLVGGLMQNSYQHGEDQGELPY